MTTRPSLARGRGSAPATNEELQTFATIYLEEIADKARGAVTRTADRCGMHRVTAHRWIKQCRELGLLPAETVDQPLVPGTAAWSRKVTASKVAAILGLSPYDSPLSCWHKMKGNVPLEQETEDHRRGHYAEPAILAWWRDQHGITDPAEWIDQPQYTRPDLPWAAATPDLATHDGEGDLPLLGDERVVLVEAKTARSLDEWGEPGTDEIPAYYYVQAMFQLHIAGADKGRVSRLYMPVWGSWFEMAEYVVDYEPDIAAGIIARCAEFAASLEADTPPPLDDTVATLQVLKALHPHIAKGDVVQLEHSVAVEFIDASNAYREAEARRRAAQSAVLDAMGAAQYANAGDVRVARRQPAKGDAIALYQVAKTTQTIGDPS